MLEGKNTLVIGGGGGGIGRAITRRLGAAGSAVAVADVDAERADEAAAEVATAGGRAVGLAVDVREPGAVDELVTRAARELGGLDILVTVVGGQLAFVPAARIHETTDEDWDLMVDLNLRYVARAVRVTLRHLHEQGKGGTIVSVGSITGVAGSPLQSAYGAAKAGLASLARSVAAEYSADGIRMNVVACGPIATPVAAALRLTVSSTGSRSHAQARRRRSPTPSSSWPRRSRPTSAARASSSTAARRPSARFRIADTWAGGRELSAFPDSRSGGSPMPARSGACDRGR